MIPTQPPYLNQGVPYAIPAEILARQNDRFSRTQGYNLWTCLLLLGLGLLTHSFAPFVEGLAFAAVWYLGVVTNDEKQHRFYLATYSLFAVTCALLWWQGTH